MLVLTSLGRNSLKLSMSNKFERNYIVKHQQIRDMLIQMAKNSNSACFHVSKIAAELGWDQRTVRAHLKVIEIDKAGAFLDPEEKQFCTKEGLKLLAGKIGLKEKAIEGQEG